MSFFQIVAFFQTNRILVSPPSIPDCRDNHRVFDVEVKVACACAWMFFSRAPARVYIFFFQ